MEPQCTSPAGLQDAVSWYFYLPRDFLVLFVCLYYNGVGSDVFGYTYIIKINDVYMRKKFFDSFILYFAATGFEFKFMHADP